MSHTDGYICKDYKAIGIQLTIGDKYLLKRIAKRLGKSTTVIDIDYSLKRKKGVNAKDMARLGCYSYKMANDVKRLGMVKNKTHILEMTDKVPNKYLSSFCRGAWDGDGTLGIYNGYVSVKLSSASEIFLKVLSKKILKNNHLTSVYSCRKDISFFVLNVLGGRRGVLNFIKWIYKHKNNLYLERKYAKVQNQIS